MKNILVINVNWIGDVIFSTPVFKALKKNYPKARIACLCVPRVREILESCPYVDEIIIYDEKGKHVSPLGKIKLIWELRRRKFDIVFLLHGSWTRASLAYWAGIPIRVGYATKKRGSLLTHQIQIPPEDIHRSNYYLNVIESFGIKVEDRKCELAVSETSQKDIFGILKGYGIKEEDFLVVVNVGGNWNLKRWPKENFASLIHRLEDEFKMRVVIPGGPQDVELAREIARNSQASVVILAGQTDLKQLLALLKRANLVISADSGPLHMASSLGKETVAIFGPTRPEITGPQGKGKSMILEKDVGCNRAPCYYLDCPNNICMQSITVDDVVSAVKQLIK